MPKRYQNGKLMVRRDVKRPYYYIWVTAPVIQGNERELKRQRKLLGFVDETPRKRAMELRDQELSKVNSRRMVAASQVTFRRMAEQFLNIRVPRLGFATQNKYRVQIENHLLPAFGELTLSEIDAPSIEDWLAAKEKAGLSWWTRIDLKGILSAIFTTAKAWKLFEGDNPTQDIRIGKKRLVREKRLLTAEELRAILAALDDRPRFIVQIIFGLGLRISEVLGLRWSDIDLEGKTVTVRRRWYRGGLSEEGETKSEASAAELRLGSFLAQEFERRHPGMHRKTEFVFIGDDGHVPPDDRDLLREEFRPVLKRLKLYYPGFGWHALRRQNITWRQTVGGATPLEAQRGARHGSLDMTLLYTLSDHERETAQQNAMFDKLMEVPIEAKPQ